MATFLAVVVLMLTAELWMPLAVIFGVIKLLATFSISAAWEATKSVPIWVWDFAQSAFA